MTPKRKPIKALFAATENSIRAAELPAPEGELVELHWPDHSAETVRLKRRITDTHAQVERLGLDGEIYEDYIEDRYPCVPNEWLHPVKNS
jgi:hypothetical protein